MTSVAVYSVYVAEIAGGATPAPRVARLQGFPQGLAWLDGQRIWSRTIRATAAESGRWISTDEEARPRSRGCAGRGGEHGKGGGLSRASWAIDIWRFAPDATPPQVDFFHALADHTAVFPRRRPHRLRVQSLRIPEIGSPMPTAERGAADQFRRPPDRRPALVRGRPTAGVRFARIGISAVYVIDVRERVPRQVATPQTNLALPVWSADRRWLLASDGREAFIACRPRVARRTIHAARSYQAAVTGERVVFNASSRRRYAVGPEPRGRRCGRAAWNPRLAFADSWAAKSAVSTSPTARPGPRPCGATTSQAKSSRSPGSKQPTALGGLGLAVSATESRCCPRTPRICKATW